MRIFDEAAVAITKADIEPLLIFIKYKDSLDEFRKTYKDNVSVIYRDHLDPIEFKKTFNLNIRQSCFGRGMESIYQFIQAIDKYYGINILTLNNKTLIMFLNTYINDFNTVEDYFILNTPNWNSNSINKRKGCLTTLKRKLNIINKHFSQQSKQVLSVGML